MDGYRKPLNGAALKLIASASMLTDHICAIFFPYLQTALLVRLSIGRIAMPLYVFMICEGFFHTHSRAKYARNLLIAALISEPVYDISLHDSIWAPGYQNVCFTLLSGFAMLAILNILSVEQKYLLHIPVIAGFCAATYFLHFSYDYSAMLAFAAFYYLHWGPKYAQGTAGSAAIAVFENTPGALLAAIPIALYSGKRGRINAIEKYMFYAFYPAHLLILYIIKII